MSQLPGTIHVKRKLVEEPLETLYIEREGSGPNLDEHSARQVYRLVKAIKRPRLSHDSLADVFSDRSQGKLAVQTPSIITEDTSIVSQPKSVTINTEAIQTVTAESSKIKNQKPLQTRRIFHLSAPRASSLSRASSASSLRGLVKRRGRHGAGVAVFTEKRIMRVDQMARVITKNGHEMSGLLEDDTTKNRPRKRPSTRSLSHQNSTTALQSSILRTEEDDSDANLKLAAELQQFAFETIIPMSSTSQPVPKSTIDSFKRKPMKYQPKPPRPRQVQHSDHLAANSTTERPMPFDGGDISKEDVSEEWVYDVYIRDIAQPSVQPADIVLQQNRDFSQENVGFIVIRAEDEEALEEFMSDDSDSEGWRDDDDDSNAEDYYANDYPDELDSDDEWKLGQGSDQEYDLNDYTISDNERD